MICSTSDRAEQLRGRLHLLLHIGCIWGLEGEGVVHQVCYLARESPEPCGTCLGHCELCTHQSGACKKERTNASSYHKTRSTRASLTKSKLLLLFLPQDGAFSQSTMQEDKWKDGLRPFSMDGTKQMDVRRNK